MTKFEHCLKRVSLNILVIALLFGFSHQKQAPSYAELVAGHYSGIYKSRSTPSSIIDYEIVVIPQNDSTILIKPVGPNFGGSFVAVLRLEDTLTVNGIPVKLHFYTTDGKVYNNGVCYPTNGMLSYTYHGLSDDPFNVELFTGERQ